MRVEMTRASYLGSLVQAGGAHNLMKFEGIKDVEFNVDYDKIRSFYTTALPSNE